MKALPKDPINGGVAPILWYNGLKNWKLRYVKDIDTKKSDFITEDLNVIWHPCTQMKDHETYPLILIEKGEGVWLYDETGTKAIDAISSWWVNLFGHCQPHIQEVISQQLQTLEHVLLAGFTHKPAINLATRLIKKVPQGLAKVFFADNGSSAIEVALKMAFHYFYNRNEVRTHFVSLKNSYHGETLGALAVGDVGLYKEIYHPLLMTSYQAMVPQDQSSQAALKALDDLEEIFKRDGKHIAAFICEPLVQCAGGMHMYHPSYLQGARALCDQYDILMIADEIAVGFGRTGKMFGCDHAGVCPDFMTLSKGITGGFLPLSVVVTTQKIYDAFYDDYETYRGFLHSHSYTGNPLACAAATAVLDIFDSYDVLQDVNQKGSFLEEKMTIFKTLSCVKNLRRQGLILAFDLEGFDPLRRIGKELATQAWKRGVLIRPLGDVVYFMPPLSISYDEIETMVRGVYEALVFILQGEQS